MESTTDTHDASPSPYAPSWANRLTDLVERLPGPTWLAYLVAMGFGIGITSLSGGESVTFELGPILYYGSLPFAVLGLIHGLDRLAGQALTALRPVLSVTDAEVVSIRRELTVAPARPALFLLLFAVVVTPIGYITDPVGSGIVGYSPGLLALRYCWETFITAVFLVLIYHTFRQLRLTAGIHERLRRIDLFDQTPLYAMSRLSSRTAIGLIVLTAPAVLLIPQDADVSYLVISFAWFGVMGVVAAAAFVLPLRGTHDRIVAEKHRLQGEVGRRLTATLDEIHDAVDARDVPVIEARNRALATLIAERYLIHKVPTWPWSTGALTGFVSAVLLPVALFLVQRLLSQIV